MGKKSRRACTLCLGFTFPTAFLAGVALIAGGVAMYMEFPSVINSQVSKRVTVEEGHATYEQLEQPSIPIFKDFYFLNLTNHEEFHKLKGGAMPNLEEVGPYSYSELRTKKLVKHENISQITYTQRKIFHFNETTSGPNLKESDIICTINIPLIGAIAEVKDKSVMRLALKTLITATGAKLYVCQQAKDLAWGYRDCFIDALHLIKMYPLPKVSIQVNDSIDDTNTSIINTGVTDITQVGQFIQWNNLRELGIWKNGSEADRVRGTEGFFFKPNLQEGDKLTAFVDDVKRSFDLEYEGTVNRLGINAHRYSIASSTFKSAFSEPKNADYFSWCPDGMFYLGPTQPKEVPVYGSKPHFLDGDPLLLKSVAGLNPNRTKHDTVIDVEPITGANVNFQRRLQVNVQVNRTEKHTFNTIHITSNVTGYNKSNVLYFPVLYIDEYASMDQDFKNYLESKGLKMIQNFETAVPAVFGFLIFLGAIFILVGFLTLFAWMKRIKTRHRSEYTPLPQSTN